MKLNFFDILWFYLFYDKCLFGLRIDSSYLPFSFVFKLGLFYSANFYYSNEFSYDYQHRIMNRRIDLIVPFLCDIILIIPEQQER